METYYAITSGGELYHWKYIKREKVDGKWKYWYDKESLKADIKAKVSDTADKTASRIAEEGNKAAGGINAVVNKGKELINKFYDDPDNIYNVTHKTYEEKLAKVKETQEWKDIVARGDSEYVKKNSDGTTTYKDETIKQVAETAEEGYKYVNDAYNTASNMSTEELATAATNTAVKMLTNANKTAETTLTDTTKNVANTVEKTVTNTANKLDSSISAEDIQKVASILSTTVDAAKSIDEGKIVDAAKVIMESDVVKDQYSNSELYKQAVDTLSNLSDEEIMLMNLLLQEMRK